METKYIQKKIYLREGDEISTLANFKIGKNGEPVYQSWTTNPDDFISLEHSEDSVLSDHIGEQVYFEMVKDQIRFYILVWMVK